MKRQRSDQEREIRHLGGFSILNEWGMEEGESNNEDKRGEERKSRKRKKAF